MSRTYFVVKEPPRVVYERFFNAVERRPALWDPKDKHYKNSKYTYPLWKEVAKICNKRASIVEKDFARMRKNYEKFLIGRRDYWSYMGKMAFLGRDIVVIQKKEEKRRNRKAAGSEPLEDNAAADDVIDVERGTKEVCVDEDVDVDNSGPSTSKTAPSQMRTPPLLVIPPRKVVKKEEVETPAKVQNRDSSVESMDSLIMLEDIDEEEPEEEKGQGRGRSLNNNVVKGAFEDDVIGDFEVLVDGDPVGEGEATVGKQDRAVPSSVATTAAVPTSAAVAAKPSRSTIPFTVPRYKLYLPTLTRVGDSWIEDKRVAAEETATAKTDPAASSAAATTTTSAAAAAAKPSRSASSHMSAGERAGAGDTGGRMSSSIGKNSMGKLEPIPKRQSINDRLKNEFAFPILYSSPSVAPPRTSSTVAAASTPSISSLPNEGQLVLDPVSGKTQEARPVATVAATVRHRSVSKEGEFDREDEDATGDEEEDDAAALAKYRDIDQLLRSVAARERNATRHAAAAADTEPTQIKDLSLEHIQAAADFQDQIYHIHDEEALAALLQALYELPFAPPEVESASPTPTPSRSLKRKSTDTVASSPDDDEPLSNFVRASRRNWVRDLWKEVVRDVDPKEKSDFALPKEITDRGSAARNTPAAEDKWEEEMLKMGDFCEKPVNEKKDKEKEKKAKFMSKIEKREKRERKKKEKELKMKEKLRAEGGEPPVKRPRGRPPNPETIRRRILGLGPKKRGRPSLQEIGRRRSLTVVGAVDGLVMKKRGRPSGPETLRRREAAVAAALAGLPQVPARRREDRATPSMSKEKATSPAEYNKPNRSIAPRRRFSPGARK